MIKIYYKNMATGAITANITLATNWYNSGANILVKQYHYFKKRYYTKTVWVH